MKQIALISFDTEVDVSVGLAKLIEKHPDAKVLVPIVESGMFSKSVIKAVFESGLPMHFFMSEEASIEDVAVVAEDITFCVDPNREVMRHIKPEDILGIVWDDSAEAHIVLHALEDYGLETWSITDGLDTVDIDYDVDELSDIKSEMIESLETFVEKMTEFVTLSVLDVLTETIAARIQEDENNKDIDPFKDNNL
jgi:hypothetical protein